MLINKRTYEKLMKCPKVPPEMGGILAGKNSVINTVIFDFGKEYQGGIKYIPNVIFLNQCILKMYTEGKEFYGIFHTHASQWKSLSDNDIKYIEVIMRAMPKEIEVLYFPIVYPEDTIKAYKAKRYGTEIIIKHDEIKIL